MSIQILYDPLDGIAALYDSETWTALGPMARYRDGMHPEKQLRAFLNWAAFRNILPNQEHWNIYRKDRPE